MEELILAKGVHGGAVMEIRRCHWSSRRSAGGVCCHTDRKRNDVVRGLVEAKVSAVV